jgi:IS1 family transposase
MKEKTRTRTAYKFEDAGDCYTWTAIEPKTKLILTYAVGKRDSVTGMEFARKLRRATFGHFQINTDGLRIYQSVIPIAFGPRFDHAQIIKIFSAGVEGEARYSPPQIVDMYTDVGGGNGR